MKKSNPLQEKRNFFTQGQTRCVSFRIEQLNKLEQAIQENQTKIIEALKRDLNKTAYEAYMTEIGTVIMEISFVRKRLKKWAKPTKVKTPLVLFPAKSVVYPEPLGVVLIISPWNYPFQLAMMPLIGAIAAGNCAIIKPSEYSSHTSKVIEEMIASIFPSKYIEVLLGGKETSTELLKEKFDLIFFTGSTKVGQVVMEAASKHLTPVILELGGKSPCIVDDSANLVLSAKRIVFGKMLNAGQTCVAPDYVLVHESVKEALIREMKQVINDLYLPSFEEEFPKIIHESHFLRLAKLLENQVCIVGGHLHEKTHQIEPTIIESSWDSPLLEEEIFGPILPVLTFEHIDEVIHELNLKAKPLALYLFTSSKNIEKKIFSMASFGGGCLNDTIMHLATPYLPFGGVGQSGMGSYHGYASFVVFSNQKSILKKSVYFDFAFRYPSYNKKLNFLKRFMK